MQHYKIVLPEHLNDYGFLFGGSLLKWVDEIAYIRVSLDLPEQKFVTVGLDEVIFRHQISKGQILRFQCERTRIGKTSVTYHVQVFGERYRRSEDRVLFETRITFVCVDDDGNKATIQGD
ncbi:MAG: acyl-CoA thioesterase [Gammaproteobacteria bacterium]|nr:acyl-CoA thioesterase [Gammaproteobacteria bacterium]